MMLRSTHWLVLALAHAALAGCGLKGPLYLPEERTSSAATSVDGSDDAPRRQGTRSGQASNEPPITAGTSQEDDE